MPGPWRRPSSWRTRCGTSWPKTVSMCAATTTGGPSPGWAAKSTSPSASTVAHGSCAPIHAARASSWPVGAGIAPTISVSATTRAGSSSAARARATAMFTASGDSAGGVGVSIAPPA